MPFLPIEDVHRSVHIYFLSHSEKTLHSFIFDSIYKYSILAQEIMFPICQQKGSNLKQFFTHWWKILLVHVIFHCLVIKGFIHLLLITFTNNSFLQSKLLHFSSSLPVGKVQTMPFLTLLGQILSGHVYLLSHGNKKLHSFIFDSIHKDFILVLQITMCFLFDDNQPSRRKGSTFMSFFTVWERTSLV